MKLINIWQNTHQYNTFMVRDEPLVSDGWLSFFSPLTPDPITNKVIARAVKDREPLRSVITIRICRCTVDLV